MFLIGGLTKRYGDTTFTPGIYATVACVNILYVLDGMNTDEHLFRSFSFKDRTCGRVPFSSPVDLNNESYSIGWTPLLFLYAPEIFNYSMRANGMVRLRGLRLRLVSNQADNHRRLINS